MAADTLPPADGIASAATLQRDADAWNALYPIGTAVEHRIAQGKAEYFRGRVLEAAKPDGAHGEPTVHIHRPGYIVLSMWVPISWVRPMPAAAPPVKGDCLEYVHRDGTAEPVVVTGTRVLRSGKTYWHLKTADGRRYRNAVEHGSEHGHAFSYFRAQVGWRWPANTEGGA